MGLKQTGNIRLTKFREKPHIKEAIKHAWNPEIREPIDSTSYLRQVLRVDGKPVGDQETIESYQNYEHYRSTLKDKLIEGAKLTKAEIEELKLAGLIGEEVDLKIKNAKEGTVDVVTIPSMELFGGSYSAHLMQKISQIGIARLNAQASLESTISQMIASERKARFDSPFGDAIKELEQLARESGPEIDLKDARKIIDNIASYLRTNEKAKEEFLEYFAEISGQGKYLTEENKQQVLTFLESISSIKVGQGKGKPKKGTILNTPIYIANHNEKTNVLVIHGNEKQTERIFGKSLKKLEAVPFEGKGDAYKVKLGEKDYILLFQHKIPLEERSISSVNLIDFNSEINKQLREIIDKIYSGEEGKVKTEDFHHLLLSDAFVDAIQKANPQQPSPKKRADKAAKK